MSDRGIASVVDGRGENGRRLEPTPRKTRGLRGRGRCGARIARCEVGRHCCSAWRSLPRCPAVAQDVPQGITEPFVLPPFDRSAPACAVPPGLERALGFAQDNERQFIEGVGAGLAAAAKDRGLLYEEAVADNDAGPAGGADRRFPRTAVRGGGHATGQSPGAGADTAAGDGGGWLCRYGRAAAGDDDPQCAAVSDRQSAGRRCCGVHPRRAGRARRTSCCSRRTACSFSRRASLRSATRSRTCRASPSIADISPNPVNEAGGYADDEVHPRGAPQCRCRARAPTPSCSGR